MNTLDKNYSEFMEDLNKENISWCLIKDYEFLMETGYDNEIDIVAESSDRSKIREIGRKIGWYESSLNNLNTHLIFWKFEDGKPYRIDIHIGRVLATAVPWFKAKDILAEKVEKEGVWTVSPKWELAILLLSSFRGRAPKEHRVKRAKELGRYLEGAKNLLRSYMEPAEVNICYDYLVKAIIFKFSKFKRLRLWNIIKEHVLHMSLFVTRLFKPSPAIVITGGTDNYRAIVIEKLVKKLKKSKLNVKSKKISKEHHIYFGDIFLKRIFSDLVILNCQIKTEDSYNLRRDADAESEVDNLIKNIYP